ncbi:MAG: butyrate kinase [Bacillota bacterium]|nr:butyrate kinase [Bacillota bacterium]
MANYKILTINPGSTSTKIAVFENETQLFETTLRHTVEELAQFEGKKIMDQYEFRKQVILDSLKANNFDIKELSAVVGRGGLLKPIEGGTYQVNEQMLKDLEEAAMGEHASNLGAMIAKDIADELGKSAYIVDPVVVDELQDIARISGIKENPRISIFHALNQKAVARRAAAEMGKKYEDLNFIVAHMGGGISVGAHEKGRVVDVNNALDGEGPFSPERSGGLPVGQLVKMCFSGKYTEAEIKKLIKGNGGLMNYLGTSDGREVSEMFLRGDEEATLVYKAMAYQVSKEIAICASVLKGKVDAVILTGGLAYDKDLNGWIQEHVGFVGKFIIYPGEDEMLALAQGGLRILKGEETAKVYQ